MDPHNQPVVVDRIDYAQTFRFTRIFDGFRLARSVPRMLLSLLLIFGVFLGGRMLDVMWGKQVLPNEFELYANSDSDDFAKWYEIKTPADDVASEDDPRTGVFDTALHAKLALFEKMIRAAMSLNIGFDQVHPDATLKDNTVIGALRKVCLIPAWLWDHHRGFLIAYLAMFTLLWSLLGGAVARSVMVETVTGRPESATASVLFAWRRLGWFILAPMIPLLVAGLFALILVVGGFVFFNVPVLDIIGALLFVVALGIGCVIALIIIGWFGAVHLMYPALAVEGVDGIDAVARGYSYFRARPWRFGWYSLIALVYGAATYLVVGLIVFVTIAVTQGAVSTGVIADAGPPMHEVDGQRVPNEDAEPDHLSRFDAMFPEPVFGRIPTQPETERVGPTGKISATILLVWNYLLMGLVAAYVISFYHAAYANIYLLLRRYTDGIDTSEIYIEPTPPKPAPAEDKVEPAAAQEDPDAPESNNTTD